MKHLGIIEKDGAFKYYCNDRYVGGWQFAGNLTPKKSEVDCLKCLKKIGKMTQKEVDKIIRR